MLNTCFEFLPQKISCIALNSFVQSELFSDEYYEENYRETVNFRRGMANINLACAETNLRVRGKMPTTTSLY